MADDGDECDVLIVGGGPAGATAAIHLAHAGWRVSLFEKASFPRFQIGESFVPATYEHLRALGVAERLRAVPSIPKVGVEFAMGDQRDEPTTLVRFRTLRRGGSNHTFNAARAEFDAMLLDAAREVGVAVHQPVEAKAHELRDGAAAVSTERGVHRGKWLIDASGHAAVVGRRLGTRTLATEPPLRKVAYFAHYEGVRRLSGDAEGCPTIVLGDEGWFWTIPLDARRTSVGLVLDPRVAREAEAPADRMLRWGIARCPMMRRRLADATGPERNGVTSDFSYRCAPYAGPGHFLVGDAALFLDPIFSTGIFLGMSEAREVAGLVGRLLAGRLRPEAARRRYTRYVRRIERLHGSVILRSYDHAFRELVLENQGPFEMQRGLNTVLAGHGMPRLPWAAWWRYKLLGPVQAVQRRRAIVPRRPRFRLTDQPPVTDEGPRTREATVEATSP